MKAMIEYAEQRGVKLGDFASYFKNMSSYAHEVTSGETGKKIAEAWKDEEIQRIWENRSSFPVGDWAAHFFERAEMMYSEDEKYVPTFQVCFCAIFELQELLMQNSRQKDKCLI